MSEFIYTQKKPQQYHGPITSSDLNEKYEQNYADLVYLYNKYGVLDKKVSEIIERIIKENIYMSNAILDLFDRIRSLESQNTNQLSLFSNSQIDASSFVSTQYALSTSEALQFDTQYNQLKLPVVSGSSHSKIKFVNPSKGQVIPDLLDTRIDPNLPGGD
jgi:type III secretory pathway component EscV